MREDNLKKFFEITGVSVEDTPEKVIDITGIELTPGDPDACLGNGEQGLECCCDECNYYLLCFLEYARWVYREDMDELPPYAND